MSVRVAARPGENPDRLIQRFKRICSKEGILKEVKKRRFYEKPSERRRREDKERVKSIRKRLSRSGVPRTSGRG
ncbi:MAG TPA: 30S ribosomal protein S21 [Planctomycetota bacterium]|nr:30S ribosomal protein S21 [Planctomycetota bacterium]OQC20363.1 MAG: 30S ribosomal protein S21 [Planctomycetes bacterium ADurb.Bin069]NMD35564.1 30S ribosomal protein S21 [Planctomycetota bacterium]HNR98652.1 30S ribosomal protein S21 [Planctomycetota bacterium]HNU25032.1 30S ribosomal protein S21 [Planctomycetota bacterium]